MQPNEQDEGGTSWPVVDGLVQRRRPDCPHSCLCAHQS